MDEINHGMKVFKMLKQTMDIIRQKVQDEFKEMNLTATQAILIGTLANNENRKISDLSDSMGLSNSTVSGIVDRLEKQGFVERVRSKEDRRVVYVNLSSDIKKKWQNHFNAIEKIFDESMKEGTQEEIDKVMEGLETLTQLIHRRKK